jgi:transcriptional regulator with XRE-family HTH domain
MATITKEKTKETLPINFHPVRAYRLRVGLSQRKLGRIADLSESQISCIERRWMKPYPNQLKRLARALGVKVSDLET